MIDDMQQSRERRLPGASRPADPQGAGLHVAYLVNQYPMVSHTFIRREILAAERLGLKVERIALRGWDAELVDGLDIAERGRTRYLLKDGVLPLISASVRTFIQQPRSFFRALGAAVRMSRKSTRPLPYHLVYLAHACRLKEQLGEAPVAHLHAHFGTNSAEVAMLARLLGGPEYSFTVHGADEADDGKYLHLDRKAEHARFVVAVSSYTRSQLLRHVPPEAWHKVKVVHCGLDRHSFAEADAAADFPSTPRFLCIARLSAEKGHLILLEAFSRIAARYPESRLVLAGDGPMRALLEQRIRDLGLDAQARITGWISSEKVREEILGCHVVVQPSFQEGLPVVLMEATALRRPVISTYVAGIPELVTPGEVGWLVPAGSVDELAEAMEKSILIPRDELRRMGAAAHKRASERHSIDREVRKLAALFARGD